MFKFIITLILSIFLTGCTTFTNKQLEENNKTYFHKGYVYGFYQGRLYQCLINLEDVLNNQKGD